MIINSLCIMFNKKTKKYEFITNKNQKLKLLSKSLENFNNFNNSKK